MKKSKLPGTLVQKKFGIGMRKFAFINESLLKVYIKERSDLSEYKLDITLLDPSPIRKRHSPRNSRIHFGILLVCLSFLTFKAITKQDEVAFLGLFLGVAILLPISYYLWVNGKKSYDLLIFFNRFSGEPAVGFHYNLPNAPEFKAFMRQLIKLIPTEESSSEEVLPTESSQFRDMPIPQQLQQLAQLKENGTLTEEEFGKAKKHLLAQLNDSPSQRKIGF